jgi:predicted anti-sigma-YlaC factor YlaD
MSEEVHPAREVLIDFAEGDLSRQQIEQVEAHLRTCNDCNSYVESLKRTYALLARDSVPEPSPGYWAYFAQRVIRRAQSKRRRWLWVLVPGAAAAALVLMVVWWGGEVSVPEPDSIDLLLAEMNTGEMVESLSSTTTYDEFVEATAEEITVLQEYAVDADDVYGLLDVLSDEETEELVSEIKELMGMGYDEDTSQNLTEPMRKEC